MADAKECDRCGRIYGEIEERFINPLEIWNDKEKRDLCPQCERDLESFYNYEFEKIEDIKTIINKLKKRKNVKKK